MKCLWWIVGAQGAIDLAENTALGAIVRGNNAIAELNELKSSHSELKGRNCNLEVRLADREHEIDELKKGSDYLASSAKDLGKKLGDATRENGLLVRQTGEMSRENRALESSIKDITKSREYLRDTYREAEAEIGSLSVKLQECNNRGLHVTLVGSDDNEQLTQNTINIGDVVRLKSGGQDMTVNGSEGNGKVLVCVWMRDSKPMDDAFHADTLELVESEPTKCEQSVDEIINDAETTLKANLDTRYHLFAWSKFGSTGGYCDFISSYPCVEDAVTRMGGAGLERAHIFDTQEGGIVMAYFQGQWHDQDQKPITPNTTSTNEEKAI